MDRNTILQIYGTNYTEMTRRLLEEADLDSEIRAHPAFCGQNPRITDPKADSGLRIGIKPNLVTPTPAAYGATTHPEVVAGIIEYLQEHGFRNIVICEGSWVGDRTAEAFDYCGYDALAQKYGVTLLDTQKDPGVTTDAFGMKLTICRCLSEIDFLINVPVLKGHCQTKVTCALKNMKGLIPNSEKRRFHSLGLHKPIAHLNTVIRQDFIVIDHICGDPDFEEGGNPMVTNCIMAAKDPVLADALACRILKYQPEEVPYLMMADDLGVGCADLQKLRLRNIREEVSVKQPASGYSGPRSIRETPGDTAAIAHKIVELNYAVEEIDSCSACYSALIEALNRLRQEGRLMQLTAKKNIRFCIGQGYRKNPPSDKSIVSATSADPQHEPDDASEPANRVGIGNCTQSFRQFIPGCPPKAEDIYQYLL